MSEPRTTAAEEGRDANNQRPVRPEITLHERPSFIFTAIRWLTLCGLIVGSLLAGLFVGREMGLLPGGGGQASGSEDVTPEQIEKVTAGGTHRAQLALGKVKQRQALDQANLISENVEKSIAEATLLEERIAQLQQDDEGKFIVASPELVAQYVAITEFERPSRIDLERLETSIDGIRQPLESSFKDELDGSVPPPDIQIELLELEKRAEEGIEGYRNAREQIDELVLRARSEGNRGTVTLEEAVMVYTRQEAEREAALLEASRTEAREAANARIAAAEAEKLKALADKEVEVKQSEMKAEVIRMEAERMKKLAEDPAIQAKFAPLLAKGRWLFSEGSYAKISAPTSYSLLVTKGYLKGYEPFAKALAGLTLVKRSQSSYAEQDFCAEYTDRPRHKMPSNEAEWLEVKELYEMFRELAPLWIEMGLLSP